MIVKRFFEDGLAQASYLIGCGASGRALVIDPNRDADLYMRAAADEGVQITDVTETHIHADFLSGSRELAARSGATLHLSDEGDAAWKYAFANEARLLKGGDEIKIGNVRVEAVHTPGHTPEHLSFVITDGAVATAPIAAATGDFIFVGDVGRPDLLERAAHVQNTMAAGARTLYQALHEFERGREDWLQLWPGHGAGSSCGKGISAVPHTTLGYERRFNWAFKVGDEATFVQQVLAGQPDPPIYFAMMKRLNKEGPTLIGGFRAPERRDVAGLPALLERGALVVDTRPADAFAAAHVPGTISIPFNRNFITWAGWLVAYDQPFSIIVGDDSTEQPLAIARALALIGLDRLDGYFSAEAIRSFRGVAASESVPQLDASELEAVMRRGDVTVLDVRSDSERGHGHFANAVHIPFGYLSGRLSELPTDRRIIVQCQSGRRSAIAASILQRAGFKNVTNLRGGYAAWQDLHRR
jgi:hydroxyacylglutathione hydrolase